MKKYLFISLIFLLPFSVFSNEQKIYSIDSEIYVLLDLLTAEAGVSILSDVRPYSGAQIKSILHRIDKEALSPSAEKAFKRIEEIVDLPALYSEKGFSFDLSLTSSFETYLHSSEDESRWQYGYEERQPVFAITAETWFNEGFYAVMEPALKESRFLIVDTDDDGYYVGNYTNIPSSFGDLNYHFPERGFFSFGGNNWNLQIGRDQLESGNGETGKLLNSAYPDYYDFCKLKGFADNFAYTWTYMNYESWTDADPATRFQVAHTLEARFFDKLTFSVNESALFYGESTELQFINPLIVYHNLFRNHPITDEDGNTSIANICMTAGIEFVPVSGLSVYGEYLLDEVQTGLEQAEYGSGVNVTPNADAHLLGVKYSLPLGTGYFTTFFEYIYTSPWCYLSEVAEASMVWSHRETSDVLNKRADVYKPLGYEYGPDSIAFAAKLGYLIPGQFDAALTVDYILKGENTIFTEYQESLEAAKMKTPSGIPEKKLVIGLSGEYEIFSFLSAGINLAYLNIENLNHSDTSVFNDFQAAVSITATISDETFN